MVSHSSGFTPLAVVSIASAEKPQDVNKGITSRFRHGIDFSNQLQVPIGVEVQIVEGDVHFN